MVCLRVAAYLFVLLTFAGSSAHAQQTGAISGQVVDTGGAVLPGVTVEARSEVLPSPRVTVSEANGDYRLPALPPGTYTVTFTLSGMQTVTRQAQVQLGQDTPVTATLGVQGVAETVTVTATAGLVERDSATIKSGVSNEQIMALPVGQEYRDLVKLIPGVQVTQDQTRGPSAGGSGQDNVYQFDGVNVTLPLFGTLSAEPSSHDIAQVTTIKGGARAVDFDRSGGFTIDSVSKSGTSRFAGEIGFQLQNDNMVAALDSGSASRFEQDRSWLTANLGGPVLPGRLHFYGSYYRPENSRQNRANLYGELPQYERTRNEGFGKLTFTPTNSVLLNFSYRDSHRLDRSDLFASNASATTGTGSEAWLKIGIAEGSWIIDVAQPPDVQVHAFRQREPGAPRQPRGRVAFVRHRHPSRSRHARHPRPRLRTGADRRADGLQLVHPAPHRSLRLHRERRPGRRRHRRLRPRAERPATSSATPGRSATTSRSAAPCRTTCTSATSAIRTRRIWSAARTAGARSPFPAAGPTSTARRSSTPRGSSSRPAAGWRRSTPSTARRASRSTTRSAGSAGRSTPACWRATTRSTARVCAKTARRCPASSRRRATSTRCTRFRSAR